MIELRKGNLLEADVEALVNTVNTAGVMGKGVALQFKKAFPEMFDAYLVACKAGEVQPGKMHVFERHGLVGPRYIINFPTKRDWRAPSKIEDIEAGLVALVQEVKARGIKSIALPPLGCGAGGLHWDEVQPRIDATFSAVPEVRVLVFPPQAAPKAEEMIVRTPRPEMTLSRANVIQVLNQYCVLGYELTLLEVHKLLYFLQAAGENLRLRFQKHTYGPYADNLRHVLNLFEGHFTQGFGDGRNKPGVRIKLLPEALAQAEQMVTDHASEQPESSVRVGRVLGLIEGFESPYGMELLSTVHWIATHEDTVTNGDSVVRAVHSWNTRKKRLMKPEHIQVAWNRLADQGWLAGSKGPQGATGHSTDHSTAC